MESLGAKVGSDTQIF